MNWQDILPLLNLLLLPVLGGIIKMNSTITRMATEIEHHKEIRRGHEKRMDKLEQRLNGNGWQL